MSFGDELAEGLETKTASEEVVARCKARGKAMLAAVKKANPKQHALVTDMAPHVAGLCPRRAGKTYAAVFAALITGELKPGAISLIISLNKKQLKRLYWEGATSGIVTLARKFGVKLELSTSELRWTHENGSIGYLLGCEDDEQLEVMRGLEADLYVIDECKSFAPGKLAKLIDDILDPQRASRQGRIMLIGTPGHIAMGPFYEATCRKAKDEEGRPYSILAGVKVDEWGRTAKEDLLWSLHKWSLQDNTAQPHLWKEAQRKKRSKKWADDHPGWLREYIGEWTFSLDNLVFSYAAEKLAGRCTWIPERTATNPTGLQPGGAWRFVAGLDFGYEAPTALVIAGYSRRFGEIRHVWDFSGRHMLTHEIADMIRAAEKRLGITLEMVFADVGNLGKSMAVELAQDFGIPITVAQKREKLDYIEQLNGAFSLSELFIIPDTTLETQLLTNAWDVDEEAEPPRGMTRKENMGRLNMLKEDPNIPNDSTDALIYLFRGCLYRFGKVVEEIRLTPGTDEFYAAKEKRELEEHRAQLAAAEKKTKRSRLNNGLPPIPRGLEHAIKRNAWQPKLTLRTSKRYLTS